jgi:hypothetical protein
MRILRTFVFFVAVTLPLLTTAQPASPAANQSQWLSEFSALKAASPAERIDFLERVIRNPIYVDDLFTQVDARVKKAVENRNTGNYSEALLDLEAAEKLPRGQPIRVCKAPWHSFVVQCTRKTARSPTQSTHSTQQTSSRKPKTMKMVEHLQSTP